MSKNELKSRLIKMGMSFDKTDHPKSYYLNLYLEKFNAQNKITRSKNSFGREMLKVKRERVNSKEKHDSDYNVEEDDKIELNDSDEEYIYEESEENDIDNKGKKISWEEEIKEKNKYYKESGIKYIRLIRRKKQKIDGGKKLFVTDQIHEDSTDKKKSFNEKNDNSINDNEKIIIINKCENKQKNEDIDINNSKKNIMNETPLKQSSQNSENIIIENNEFSKENKIPKSENINTDINIKSSSLEKKSPSQSPSKSNQKTPPNSNVTKITFGAPKSANENNNIHLSKGPVVFGFKKSTDAEKKVETESEKDKKMFKTVVNKSKIYDNFVKNVTKSVIDNANQSPEKKAKTIYLKWDTPRQKEFLKNYMDEYPLNNELNSENKITVNYDFNERLNNYDDNEYKHKLRSYNKNINKYEDNNINNSEKKDDINEEKEMKSNNHFFHKDNLENNQRNNYIENQNYENDYNDKKDSYQDNYDNDNYNNNMYVEESSQKKEYPKNNESNNNYNNYYDNNDYSMQESNEKNMNMNNNSYNQNAQYNYKDIINNNINDNNQMLLENKIKYSNYEAPRPQYEESDIYERDETSNINNTSEISTESRRTKFLRKIRGIKNSVMNKFKNTVYIWPLLLLIVFGIVYLLNSSYERFDNINIIIIFSILMALLILYNVIKCFKTMKNYKKMAKADKKALLELLSNLNINREALGNNTMLINNFILQCIKKHNLTKDEYMKYVFRYLKKYLAEDGFIMNQEDEKDQTRHEFWREI